MIIREKNQTITMIEQNHHAHLSAEIIEQWKDVFFKDDPYFKSVLYAIKYHDYGWHHFDRQPFLNDQTQLPYSFIDFPILPKTVLYTQGVDKVEEVDSYAAVLCSTHYMRFMENNTHPEVQKDMTHEKKRTNRILTELASDQATFDKHVAVLQFADNISLDVCLKDPRVIQPDVHYFVKEGIPIALNSDLITQSKLHAELFNNLPLKLTGLPFVPNFSIPINQMSLNKQIIKESGFINANNE